MRVVDLRPGRAVAEPRLAVWASPAAELTQIAAALAGTECTEFDVGEQRIAELAAALAPEVRDRLQEQPGKELLLLTALVSRLPEPGTVADLFALLEDEPVVVWRTLIDTPMRNLPGYDPTVLDRYLAGQEGLDVLTGHIAEVDADGTLRDGIAPILVRAPAAVAAELADLLRHVHDTVGATMLAEGMGPIEREVAARRAQADAGVPVARIVLEATNGYELTDDLPVDEVLLLPSYWFRPWMVITRIGRTEVLTSPVADEHLHLPSAAPPPSLVKLCKALGDEGRLRLLRRMGGGPITLTDAMDELDVAKTTAHHHLSTLRQAGLVVIRGEGRDSRYALRVHPPQATAAALEAYVGPTTIASQAAEDRTA